MDSGTATQLITVGATLGGVVLTSVGNAFLERRRARDSRELGSLRSAAGHAAWLRDERLKAYAGLSLAGVEALQFIRSDLRLVLGPDAASQLADTEPAGASCALNCERPTTKCPSSVPSRHGWPVGRSGGLPATAAMICCVT